MPNPIQRQRNLDEALRLCATQGHHMEPFWTTRRGVSTCRCRDCGATAVVTRDGVKQRPPTADRGHGGGAPWYPCPRNGHHGPIR